MAMGGLDAKAMAQHASSTFHPVSAPFGHLISL